MMYDFKSSGAAQAARQRLDLSRLDTAMQRLRLTVQETEDTVFAARKRARQRDADRAALREELRAQRPHRGGAA